MIHGKTGIHFPEQTVTAIRQAVDTFEAQQAQFDAEYISQFAQQFSVQRFREDINQHIEKLLEQKI